MCCHTDNIKAFKNWKKWKKGKRNTLHIVKTFFLISRGREQAPTLPSPCGHPCSSRCLALTYNLLNKICSLIILSHSNQ